MTNHPSARGESFARQRNRSVAVVADSIRKGSRRSRFSASKNRIILQCPATQAAPGEVRGIVLEVASGLGRALARADHAKQ